MKIHKTKGSKETSVGGIILKPEKNIKAGTIVQGIMVLVRNNKAKEIIRKKRRRLKAK